VSGFASLLQRWYVPSMDVSTLGWKSNEKIQNGVDWEEVPLQYWSSNG
jgi:hypothetical protein